MNKIQAAQRNSVIALHKQAIRVELARHPEIKNILKMFPPALRKDVGLRVSDFGDGVNFSLRIQDLESFKDKKLGKLLAKFAGDEWASQTNDYTNDMPNRDFPSTARFPGHPSRASTRVGSKPTAARTTSLTPSGSPSACSPT